jgi:hypothetical protein
MNNIIKDNESEEDESVIIIRVSGGMICPMCGKAYRDHPDDPRTPWPTFVRLCNGFVGKL